MTHRELGLTATTLIVAGSETSKPDHLPKDQVQVTLNLQQRSRHAHIRPHLPPPLQPSSPRKTHNLSQKRLSPTRNPLPAPTPTARIPQRRPKRSPTPLPPSPGHVVPHNNNRARHSRRPTSPTPHEPNHKPLGRPPLRRKLPPPCGIPARALARKSPRAVPHRRQSRLPPLQHRTEGLSRQKVSKYLSR